MSCRGWKLGCELVVSCVLVEGRGDSLNIVSAWASKTSCRISSINLSARRGLNFAKADKSSPMSIENRSNLSGMVLLAKFVNAVITSDWNAEGSEDGEGVGGEDLRLREYGLAGVIKFPVS